MVRSRFDWLFAFTLALLIHAAAVGWGAWQVKRSLQAETQVEPKSDSSSPTNVTLAKVEPSKPIQPELKEFELGVDGGQGAAVIQVEADPPNQGKLADQEQPQTRIDPKQPHLPEAAPPPAPKVTQPGTVAAQQTYIPPAVRKERRTIDPTAMGPAPDSPPAPIDPKTNPAATDESTVNVPKLPDAKPEAPPAMPSNSDGAATDATAMASGEVAPNPAQGTPTPAPTPPSDAPNVAPTPQVATAVDGALDPALFAKSDSDPFSTEEGVTMTEGGTKARGGHEVKGLHEPRVDQAFIGDFRAMGGKVAMLYKVDLDATGHPREVTVLQSSGSDIIDQACRRSLLAATFEGKRPDTFTFGFVIHFD